MVDKFEQWLIGQGITSNLAHILRWVGLAIGLIAFAYIINYVARRIIVGAIAIFVRRTQTRWDDILFERKVFSRLSHLAPALVFYYAAPLFAPVAEIIQRLAMVYMMIAGLLAVIAFLNGIADIYQSYDISRQKPIKGYIQITVIALSIVVGIVALSTAMNRDPRLLLTGLGAMTAVLILVFKDSILGLVASVQISANNLVQIGDWIEMPKYGADGDVVDITLMTVKVQNWDKTYTNIPAYFFISDSFKNWRGMAESGGRRIKRAIYIDMNTIKLCNEEMLNRYEKYELITDYVRTRRKEILDYNVARKINISELINGRRMTNIGTFRAYVAAYLRNHPKVNTNMTFMVRHLAPGEHGLPIEIYVFSKDQEWVNYEAIQADIFDHILAVVPRFDLRVFQSPGGSDIERIGARLADRTV
jgi:miniconductance mechanosensitive channel